MCSSLTYTLQEFARGQTGGHDDADSLFLTREEILSHMFNGIYDSTHKLDIGNRQNFLTKEERTSLYRRVVSILNLHLKDEETNYLALYVLWIAAHEGFEIPPDQGWPPPELIGHTAVVNARTNQEIHRGPFIHASGDLPSGGRPFFHAIGDKSIPGLESCLRSLCDDPGLIGEIALTTYYMYSRNSPQEVDCVARISKAIGNAEPCGPMMRLCVSLICDGIGRFADAQSRMPRASSASSVPNATSEGDQRMWELGEAYLDVTEKAVMKASSKSDDFTVLVGAIVAMNKAVQKCNHEGADDAAGPPEYPHAKFWSKIYGFDKATGDVEGEEEEGEEGEEEEEEEEEEKKEKSNCIIM